MKVMSPINNQDLKMKAKQVYDLRLISSLALDDGKPYNIYEYVDSDEKLNRLSNPEYYIKNNILKQVD